MLRPGIPIQKACKVKKNFLIFANFCIESMILTTLLAFLSSPGFLKACEFFSLITFAVFLVLQILHHKLMWYVYIPSCIAAAYVFFSSQTWAMGVLNIYYIVMGFVGIVTWKKEREQRDPSDKSIPLNRMSRKVAVISLIIAVIGIPLLYFILRALADPNPLLDSITTTLSIIGTWWLTLSYIHQWYMWIVADVFAIALNLNLGKYFLVIQFAICIIASIIGLWNWTKNGKYLTE